MQHQLFGNRETWPRNHVSNHQSPFWQPFLKTTFQRSPYPAIPGPPSPSLPLLLPAPPPPPTLAAGRCLRVEKKKRCPLHTISQKGPQVGGDWRFGDGWWQLVAVGGGWWRSVVGDWWLVAVGSGWQLAAVGGWRRLAVGGWWRLVVGGWWSLGP